MVTTSEMVARVCPEDVVVLASDPSTPGMVCCIGEDTESPSGSLPTAHVYWLREHDNDKMEPISELKILDRALLHGDTVVHNKRKGLVTATRIRVDMRYADGTVVKGVPTDQIRHLQPFRQGNWVVAEGWLGRVLSCRDDVVVQFEDGAQCMVSATANAELQAVQKMYERSPFFPSMAVKASNADTFSSAQWICGSYTKQKQGVVASTRPAEVLVAWVAALQGSSAAPPSTSCVPESLSLLNHFGHTWWRLGDRTIYPREGGAEDEDNSDMRNCCEIIRTETLVDIKYLDGSCAVGVPATATLMFNPGPHEFYPGDLVCDKDSGDLDEKANTMSVVISADERSRMAVIRRVGPVVRRTHDPSPEAASTEQEPSAPGSAPASGEHEGGAAAAEEAPGGSDTETITCSVFDLQAHPDFSFRMGDVVLRLDTGAPPSEQAMHTMLMHDMVEDDEHRSYTDDEDSPTVLEDRGFSRVHAALFSEGTAVRAQSSASGAEMDQGTDECSFGRIPYLSSELSEYGGTVGEVMDVESSGYVLVAWQGAALSRVHPEEIYRVAIEEEVEDAMFYQDDNAYNSVQSQQSNGGEGSTASVSSSMAGDVAWAAVGPLVNASVKRVVIPTVNAMSRVGMALSSVPVLGVLLESSTLMARGFLAHVLRLFVPNRLLPTQMQTAAAGSDGMRMSLALSPSLLASTLALGRFLGLPYSTKGSSPLAAPSEAEDAEMDNEEDAAQEQPSPVAGAASSARGQDSPVDTSHDASSPQTAAWKDSSQHAAASVDADSAREDAAAGTKAPGEDRLAHASTSLTTKPGAASSRCEAESAGAKEEGQDTANAQGGAAASSVSEGSGQGSRGVGSLGLLQEPEGPVEFEKVQIVEDERAWEGHHYASRTETPRSAGKFMSRVQKEWNLLRGSLPPDIFMVVYEDRCDLLQAVIKGPQDSPYADGLFFFDIQLPSEYPDVPPRVYYHSHGDRLNPNLYENGKVCLSLLGTWAGSSVESWDPAKSNILQVVVSIQGLILVPEPYYNEPSYEQYRGTEEGQRSSDQYNESAMLLTLQSILASARHPPPYFAKLVESHYRETRQRLLDRCRSKLQAAKQEAQGSEDGGSSLGFALSLERMVPRLEAALWSFPPS